MLENGPIRFLLDKIDEEDKELLDYLHQEFYRNYNHYLRVIRETGILSKKLLEKKTTINARRKNVSYPLDTGLLANTRQCARDKAVECVRLYRSLKKRNVRTEHPESMFETINPRLNWRDGYKIDSNRDIRISVKKGARIYAKLNGPEKELELLDKAFVGGCRFTAAEISKEGSDYFIHVNLSPTNGI